LSFIDATGIATLTKNGPNLLLDHEVKPLKMRISTIGESPVVPENLIWVSCGLDGS
jgi:hypothetical protein